jgi:hypothetical protein
MNTSNGETCEGGPDGFAIGNKPWSGNECDDIALGIIAPVYVVVAECR